MQSTYTITPSDQTSTGPPSYIPVPLHNAELQGDDNDNNDDDDNDDDDDDDDDGDDGDQHQQR